MREATGRYDLQPVAGSAFELRADLVLLALGFTGAPPGGLVAGAGIELGPSGLVRTAPGRFETSRPRLFACGDVRRGQSLVVWAIREGRDCAAAVHAALAASAAGPQLRHLGQGHS